ncbi:MAG TPA: LLM class flavin-dependent oxidoreductase [Stellaceae bacterium]|nr:LLM class flavin-dependent oxidoreductase [Stellaceae bacterium]
MSAWKSAYFTNSGGAAGRAKRTLLPRASISSTPLSASGSTRSGWLSFTSRPSARCCPRRSTSPPRSPAAPSASRSASPCRYCRSAIRCGSPRRPRPSITSGKGRPIFGAGRSGLPRTYEAYGLPYGESRERFNETLDILRHAWTEERFSFRGNYYKFDNVCLVPKPYQRPHPPIRVAANSDDTFAAMGRLGLPILVAVRRGTLEELAPNLAVYREAWRASGHPGEGEVYLRVPVHVGGTDAEARAVPEESIMYFYRYLGERLADSATRAGVSDAVDRAARGQRLQNITYEEALRDKVIVGSPASVVDRLKGLERDLGIDGILAELNCGGLLSAEDVTRSLQLLCAEVMSAVH